MEAQKNTSNPEKTSNPVIKNGVNLTQLSETIKAIQADPKMADFVFMAKNKWIDGGHNQICLDEYRGANTVMSRAKPFKLDADEPPVLLGRDLGPNPVEYILAALSSCMTTTLAYHAAAQGFKVECIESSYEGDVDLHGFLKLDPTVRPGYQEIRTKFKVKSEADKAKVMELLKHSPVYDIVTRPVKVCIEVECE